MRRDNDGMDVITRTEFDEAMKQVLTKKDLDEARVQIGATIAATMADTKSDIIAGIDQTLMRAWLDTREHTTRRVTEAKLEIVSVNKKNIADAVAPLDSELKTLAEGQKALAEGQGAIAKDVATIAEFARAVLDEHENRLKDAKL